MGGGRRIPASGTDLKSRKGLYWNRGFFLGFVGWENHGKRKGGDGLMK
jgi:hypothetical protein